MNNNLNLHIRFWEYEFYSPHWLWLLILIPILLVWRYFQLEKSAGVFKFSRPVKELKAIEFSPIKWLIIGVYSLIGIGMALLIFALARPHLPYSEDQDNDYGEGIDIMIAMDISGSMMATDFLPNRLEAAKDVAKEFIDGRKSDRIGFVVFEGEAYTACPATRNYDYLKHSIDEVESGMIEPGTAIGTGLGTAVARLKSDSLKSKVIILLTDGESNKGDITPMSAAELAKKKDITLYTIGVGKKGFVEMPINTPFGKINQKTKVNIDENLLTDMAKLTQGKYFRATDKNSLRTIYKTINEMEKRKIVDNSFKREPPYQPTSFLLFGLIFIFLGTLVEQLILRRNA